MTNVFTGKEKSILERVQQKLETGYWGEIQTKLDAILIPRDGQPLETTRVALLEVMRSVLRTMMGGGLYQDTELENHMGNDYYDSVLYSEVDRITYSVCYVASDYLLGQLLYYMNRFFIFNYVRDTIVVPNLKLVLQEIQEKNEEKRTIDYEEEQTKILHDHIEKLILAFLIHMDEKEFLQQVQAVRSIAYKDKETVCTQWLEESPYAIPTFLYDMVRVNHLPPTTGDPSTMPMMLTDPIPTVSIDHLVADVEKFFERYQQTHTDTGLQELFREFCQPTMSIRKIEKTILDRNASVGILSCQRIDGISVQDCKILTKILRYETLTAEETSYLEKQEILLTCHSLVKQFGGYDVIWSIDNTMLTYSRSGRQKQYAYRNQQASKIVTDPFHILGRDPELYRTELQQHPERSCLTQTGMTKEDHRREMITQQHVDKLPWMQRIHHRKALIQKLTKMFERNEEVMNEVRRIRNFEWKTPKYIQTSRRKAYIIARPETLLYTLVETDVLYEYLKEQLESNHQDEK